MSTGTIRPRRTTTNLGLRVPGDIDPADFVGDIGNLADDIDRAEITTPAGPPGPPGQWWIGTQAQYNALTPQPGTLYLITT